MFKLFEALKKLTPENISEAESIFANLKAVAASVEAIKSRSVCSCSEVAPEVAPEAPQS